MLSQLPTKLSNRALPKLPGSSIYNFSQDMCNVKYLNPNYSYDFFPYTDDEFEDLEEEYYMDLLRAPNPKPATLTCVDLPLTTSFSLSLGTIINSISEPESCDGISEDDEDVFSDYDEYYAVDLDSDRKKH
ncbi:hypothetical protein D0Z00_001357 [Geotrichum galactomycetum]|uniref:Uncharacterized protein n=1 Tax=Geotrichum galactomycetum TaxID=27317 RepID=A0ACB6V7B8_9ASCO|nr:hypothetical protein D0Z00_001357 [Geotrichum candidum]